MRSVSLCQQLTLSFLHSASVTVLKNDTNKGSTEASDIRDCISMHKIGYFIKIRFVKVNYFFKKSSFNKTTLNLVHRVENILFLEMDPNMHNLVSTGSI